jgi:hypothetical protein
MSIWERIRQAWERKLRKLRETEVSQEEIKFFEKVRRVLERIEEQDRQLLNEFFRMQHSHSLRRRRFERDFSALTYLRALDAFFSRRLWIYFLVVNLVIIIALLILRWVRF